MPNLPVVLVIEDDKVIQGLVEDALRDGEFEPATAASGEEAVTLLKAFRSNYSALITDISLLGQMDGWRVARAAREIDPAFPIIYITGVAGNVFLEGDEIDFQGGLQDPVSTATTGIGKGCRAASC